MSETYVIADKETGLYDDEYLFNNREEALQDYEQFDKESYAVMTESEADEINVGHLMDRLWEGEKTTGHATPNNESIIYELEREVDRDRRDWEWERMRGI